MSADLAWPGLFLMASRLLAARGRAPASDESDESLVARAVNDDPDAHGELYRRHVDHVWRRLTRLLGPDPDREDLTQQIFFEVFCRLERFRGEARFGTFLHRVTVNKALDQMVRRRRLAQPYAPESFDRFCGAESTPEERTSQRQQLTLAFELLEQIKPKKRLAFVLRVIDGLSLEEIAELVDANVPAVAMRVRHAHLELQALMERRSAE
jgi:RNA polymerase sigma-70 factor, ECF subfamily